jgi:ABC-2 type transport system ATP-binding protein
MAEPLVDVRGLAKHYDGRVVVQGVTLYLMPGDLVALAGANGGGKTTTLRMLAGLLRPDAGEGDVLGQPVGRLGAASRTAIGYMGQRLALYPDLTVAENLRFHAALHGVADWAAATDAYDLGDVLKTRFGDLSGGWARRVQFAATLLHRPPLLLLDEPTAGLDAATRRTIWGWLHALAGQGHAIVLSTHDLAEAERAPEVIVYENGIAGGVTTPAAIMAEAGTATLEAALLARAE